MSGEATTMTLHERYISRNRKKGTEAEVTFLFIVDGCTESDTDVEVYAFVYANAGTDYDGMKRKEISVEKINDAIWAAEVVFRSPTKSEVKQMDVGENKMSFEIGGGTTHITHSVATLESKPEGAPDFGRAINFDGKTVHGVDIHTPQYQFSETWIFKEEDATDQTYRIALAQTCNTVNAEAFRGFLAGEVMFLGCSGSTAGADAEGNIKWALTFKFAVSLNRSQIEIGGYRGEGVGEQITIENKRGWDYLWVFFKDYPTSDGTFHLPRAAYVEQVYEDGDFSLIIGTP